MSTSSESLAPKGYLLIHLSVLLFGCTPIMGRLITIDALPLVWWRMLVAAVVLLFIPLTWRGIRKLPLKLILVSCAAGIVLSITWILFYISVKLTNASIAAICIATAPLFVAIFGPLVQRRTWQKSDLMLALAVIPGIILVVGGIPGDMYIGFLIGLLSAVMLVLFSGINKLLANRTNPLSTICIEMAAGTLFTSLVIFLFADVQTDFALPDFQNLVLILIFGVFLTALPVVLTLMSLRYISVFAQQMAVNLEPVYAVIIAIPILGEQKELTPLFYIGVVVIVGTVMFEPALIWLKNLKNKV